MRDGLPFQRKKANNCHRVVKTVDGRQRGILCMRYRILGRPVILRAPALPNQERLDLSHSTVSLRIEVNRVAKFNWYRS